jgi:hypothetical protein
MGRLAVTVPLRSDLGEPATLVYTSRPELLPVRRPNLTALTLILALAACDPQPPAPDPQALANGREPRRHRASISDPRPLESVTGPLLFEGGCWVVASGENRIALFFPRETKLAAGGTLEVGARRLREGETYKFVGDLSETAAEKLETCNGLPFSMAVGDVWPPQPERPQWKDSLTAAPAAK